MLNTRLEIEDWLKEMEIKNYTIHKDLTVSVKGKVFLDSKGLTELPIQFREVDFLSLDNNKLTSLKGCPKIINGRFICCYNNLTSFEGGPEVVLGNIDCYCNNIINLDHFPKNIGGSINIYGNPMLTLKNTIEKLDGKLVYFSYKDAPQYIISKFEHLYTEDKLELTLEQINLVYANIALNKELQHRLPKKITDKKLKL